MAKAPSRNSGPEPTDHGPLRPERIPSSTLGPTFLHDLKQQNKKVVPVPEGWDGNPSSLPSDTDWVIYPNGDLERVSI
jgi:hypothetical protein